MSLFSGGKDSAWALYRALQTDRPVDRLLTVHPTGESYLYHVPATELCSLAAESIDIPLVDVRPESFVDAGTESGPRGDAELEPLERALRDLDDELAAGVAGITVGAVESDYQYERVSAMAQRIGIDVFAPLWQRSPVVLAEEMLAAGFEITIIQVGAGGLDESWLGRTLDEQTLEELIALRDSHGVHPLGEGGEFETLVTDGPHMSRPIAFDAEPRWDGIRGSLEITDAWLGHTNQSTER